MNLNFQYLNLAAFKNYLYFCILIQVFDLLVKFKAYSLIEIIKNLDKKIKFYLSKTKRVNFLRKQEIINILSFIIKTKFK